MYERRPDPFVVNLMRKKQQPPPMDPGLHAQMQPEMMNQDKTMVQEDLYGGPQAGAPPPQPPPMPNGGVAMGMQQPEQPPRPPQRRIVR